MIAFLVSTGLVALAEIGDKTQLLALLLAAKFRRPVPIILGILVATLANHALAGLVGSWITSVIAPDTLRWILGISFIAMAIWALVPDKANDAKFRASRLGIFGTTLIAFFLLEMGDKTQVATVALAARYDSLIAVVAGTTLGMMIANVPAVLIGEAAARKLPLRAIRIVAAAIFLLLGVIALLGPRLFGHAVKEVHETRLERVLGADHHQPFALDELLQDFRAVPQLVCGHADVRSYRVVDENLGIARKGGVHEGFHRWTNAIHDRVQVSRLILGRSLKLLESGQDGATARVTEHDHEPGTETLRGELNAPDLRRRHDVARDADHEEIPEPLVEDDLRRHA
jgi:putative Ca2+/H+ antiporter (TMEM165/GDT1 family)